jgi:hypothetical protein
MNCPMQDREAAKKKWVGDAPEVTDCLERARMPPRVSTEEGREHAGGSVGGLPRTAVGVFTTAGELISHGFLTDWLDSAGPGAPASDTRSTLTCGYRFCRTGRTRGTDLRVKRAVIRFGIQSIRMPSQARTALRTAGPQRTL